MRFYRVESHMDEDASQGFSWYTSRAAAEAAMDEEDRLEVVDVVPTKQGILRALRTGAVHPDNG